MTILHHLLTFLRRPSPAVQERTLSKYERPVEPPNEAAGCVACDTCGGYRAVGLPCASCVAQVRRVVELEARVGELEADLQAASRKLRAWEEWGPLAERMNVERADQLAGERKRAGGKEGKK